MQLTPPPGLVPGMPELPVPPPVVPIPPRRRRPARRQAPLPDPMAVRRIAIPDFAPPFEGEKPGPAGSARAGQGEPVTEGPPGRGPGSRGDSGHGPSGHGPSGHGPGSPGKGGPPGPGAPGSPGGGAGGWPSQFAQVLAETLAGSRPAQQLVPWTTEETRRRIRQLGPMLATRERPRVRRVITSAPAADVLEMTAVVGFGPRVRVLALRLERPEPRERWRCTVIESA
jgi:hypothetical protein